MKDVCFNVNKDIYNNCVRDEDEIEALKVVEGPKPTIVALGAEDDGNSTKHTTMVSLSHFEDVEEELGNAKEEIVRDV
ncbi:hypothetical protein DEO72_LG6g964 [Vigna unguiculata]|uniref:Uncharacterized protein n=1 Tax=Vigna unguiculata TaxID=3917 RepID=A0A4D6M4R1_VIGUN|nr:hypothetical protein DEO72_LG6g964 [Vigna unguiculata]